MKRNVQTPCITITTIIAMIKLLIWNCY